MIRTPETFARDAHVGQFRRGALGLPYDTHLAEVADFVARHGGDSAAVAAAWLHDTVEDTDVTFADLEKAFGATITGLVRELTDDKSLPKAERKRMQVVNAPHKSPRAALVKLGDKTSNVRSLVLNPPGWPVERTAAYVAWASEVVAALPALPDAALDEFRQALVLHEA